MGKVALIGLGGFLGSIFRYWLGGLVVRSKGASGFPWETLVVNVAGCLMIGLLSGLSDARGVFGPTTRAFLFVGLLGGFTTFSTFGLETFELLRRGQSGAAMISVMLQVVVGIGAVWAGHVGSRMLWSV